MENQALLRAIIRQSWILDLALSFVSQVGIEAGDVILSLADNCFKLRISDKENLPVRGE